MMRNALGRFVTTAVTGYGHVADQGIRVSIVRYVKTGTYGLIRADGTHAPLPFLPTEFRSSGDVVHVAASMVETVSMTAFSWDDLPAHEWKPTYSPAEFILKMDPTNGPAIVAALYPNVDKTAKAA